MNWNNFLSNFKNHNEVEVNQYDEESGQIVIRVAENIPSDIDELIRENGSMVIRKTETVFEVNYNDS